VTPASIPWRPGANENRDGSLDVRELGSSFRFHAVTVDALR
jgi:hypothetical protein